MKHYPVIIATLILIGICIPVMQNVEAQTTAGIMPYIQQQFFDNNGVPLNGGLVYTYAGGTTTPATTYTDSTGGTPNANPVVLDSAGRASIWLGASGYKFVIKTSGGSTVRTVDGVTAPTLSTASVTIPSGQSLTLQSGSTTSFATNLIPSGSRNLGSSGSPWTYGYLANLVLSGNTAFTAGDSFDIGTPTGMARNTWAWAANATSQNVCYPGVALGGCYTISGGDGGSPVNSFVTVKDDNGNVLWKWSVTESGSATGQTVAGQNLVPDSDNTRSLGSTTVAWGDVYAKGQVHATNYLQVGGSSNTGIFRLPVYTLTGLSSASTGAGYAVWCTNCSAGTTPCATGAHLGAIATWAASYGQWECH